MRGSPIKARLKSILGFLGRHWPSSALVAAIVVVLMKPHTLERHFVYYPTKVVEDTPRSIGLAFEILTITTEDGLRLKGWFVPRPGSHVTLLIFHGNAGNIGHRVPWIQMLHQAGAQVAIIDYRGYGESEGNPFEDGLYRDARAAHAWWMSRFAHSDQKLVLMAESIGGAVAVDLAAGAPVSGIILQSTFSNAWDMAKTLMPLGLLQPLTGVHFDSSAKIGKVHCPKLFIHGDRDEIVPFRLGRKLFDAAPPPKDFFEVPGAGHNDLPWIATSAYIDRIRKFLESIS